MTDEERAVAWLSLPEYKDRPYVGDLKASLASAFRAVREAARAEYREDLLREIESHRAALSGPGNPSPKAAIAPEDPGPDTLPTRTRPGCNRSGAVVGCMIVVCYRKTIGCTVKHDFPECDHEPRCSGPRDTTREEPRP